MKQKIIVLSILFVTSLFAKEVSFSQSLSLLLENNKELQSKKLTIDQAKAYLDEITATQYGKLSFKEQYTNTNHAGHVFNSKLSSRNATFSDFGLASYSGASSLNVAPNDLNYPESVDNFETKLTYDVPLFTGFKISNAKDIAQLQLQAKKVKYNYDKKLLTLELLKAYNATVAAKEYVKAIKKAKKTTTAFKNYASELFEEGLVTSIDLKQAQVHDYKVNAKLQEAQNKVALALAYLGFLTNDTTISGVEDFEYIQLNESPLSQMQEEAVNKREDYAFMSLNKQTSQKNINIQKASYYPTIGTHLEYGYNNNKLEDFTSKKDFYIATIGLEFKLFDSTRSAKVEQTRIQFQQISLQQAYMKDAIELEIKENVLNLQTKQGVLQEKQKAQELAEDILVQSEEMYKNQLTKMTDLLRSQASLQEAKAHTIMSHYELTLALAKLKISLGQSLKE